MKLSTHDREVLTTLVQDKVATLRPLTQMGLPWRESFEKEASRLSALRGRVDRSDVETETLQWALAHRLLLDEETDRG